MFLYIPLLRNKSESQRINKGNRDATHFGFIIDPANKAVAPTAVKFGR